MGHTTFPRTPSLPMSSELPHLLKQRVLARSGHQLSDLEIHVHEGIVRATGQANSFYAKQLVTHSLLEGAPHLEVENSLQVAR